MGDLADVEFDVGEEADDRWAAGADERGHDSGGVVIVTAGVRAGRSGPSPHPVLLEGDLGEVPLSPWAQHAVARRAPLLNRRNGGLTTE